jgi:predicted DNA-binding protein with PD1-like motif
MPHGVIGKISDIIYLRLDKDQDLYEAIKQAARDYDIKTGVVIDITGGLTKGRFQKFVSKGDHAKMDIVEIEGPIESSGHGYVGMTEGSNEPYVHVHITGTTADETICGHLMPGTLVRSHMDVTHFTIILGKVEGVSLTKASMDDGHGKKRVYHDLKPA